MAGLCGQQFQSNGILTLEPGMAARGTVSSPPLPPNSTELAYDSGIYSGLARNLQNANIQPGWSYWAQAVRFTPQSPAGLLLQVRYVAVTQWGSGRDFDLIIRNATGLVLATLPQQTANVDSTNWQVIDVSSLHLVLGSQEFWVELRPSNPCSGQNGFTIPFDTPSSGHSQVSADCADVFSSFSAESKNLFIRAVVENAGPTLSVQNLQAGQSAIFQSSGITPNQLAWLGMSLQGPGPWLSPYGLANLSPPVMSLPMLANSAGDASLHVSVPLSFQGRAIWFQIADASRHQLGQSFGSWVQ